MGIEDTIISGNYNDNVNFGNNEGIYKEKGTFLQKSPNNNIQSKTSLKSDHFIIGDNLEINNKIIEIATNDTNKFIRDEIETYNQVTKELEKEMDNDNNEINKYEKKNLVYNYYLIKVNHIQKLTMKKSHRHIMDIEDDTLLFQETEEDILGYRSYTRLQFQPTCITGGQLKPYQLEGLNWLIYLYESGLNGILADEMGLGKTFQTISLLAYLKEYRNIDGVHLILSPKSTLGNWINEINRFCPCIKTLKFHGNSEERNILMRKILTNEDNNKDYNVIVTSYEMCLREKSWFMKKRFHSVIIDEAHRIKNESSKLSQIVRNLETKFRLLITGTPLQNSLKELWSLLNFLFPEIFSSSDEFETLFDLQSINDNFSDLSQEQKEKKSFEIIERLHKILRPFMLRRIKSEVEIDIPPKKEILLYVPLTNMQRTLYRDILSKNIDALQERDSGGRVRLINLAMQLRKACNHPYLFDGYEDKNEDPFGEHVIENSGKMIMLDRLTKKLLQNGSRILIFSQMARILDILEDFCYMRKYKYCRIDGNTSTEDRDTQISDFNKPNSDISIFLLSTRAGGLGVNLATADIVIIYDSDWNPQVDLQAMDRAHRIGQKKPVYIYRLFHENTIEEKILERANLKLQLESAIIQQGKLKGNNYSKTNQNNGNILSKNELVTMIQYGTNEILKTKDINITDDDIDAIISNSEERTKSLQVKIQKYVKRSLIDFSVNSNVNSSLYEFEGIDYNEIQKQQDKQAWNDIAISTVNEEREGRRRSRIENQNQRLIDQILLKQHVKNAPKLPHMYEWQFYNRKRILELHEIEVRYNAAIVSGIINITGDKIENSDGGLSTTSSSIRDGSFENISQKQFDFKQIRNLSQEEKEEKAFLLGQGFKNWTRKDLHTLIKLLELYGREDIENIYLGFNGTKNREEIKRYINVFFERGPSELSDWDKWQKKIQIIQEIQNKKKEIEDIIRWKQCKYKDSWKELNLNTTLIKKDKIQFNIDEDRYLLNMIPVIGYGNWDHLKNCIRQDPIWKFDWFLKSRSPSDLGKRVDFLIKILKKEYIDANEETKKDTFENLNTKNMKKRTYSKRNLKNQDIIEETKLAIETRI
ncbi:SNF2 family N-terminal domain-containing protein [Cryptosporidium muris RN66]|uniref:SNF2 family N-terminal domain-containing protein n=1 Tax=Cryptosporidium muris (strain RN66) TaxID=441375 RepID=B6ACM4_CRYMR|nr:SNF2 family N-terminal domain-containing protein [Cryptosporidium muris RN66]EEA05878.1 SNF2 family N-terminal domain-containing protein [Cryptosporidium muris RN66]|eukprot:XP_002140227.1 SNF2 family N-terminal domain-containing protein [Cryptosporidium muris RN66]